MKGWPWRQRRVLRQMRAMAECMRVSRVLQSYLDGETDEATARRVAAHLKECRRCGFEAATYREIKSAGQRREAPDPESLARLRGFVDSLLLGEGEPGEPGEPGVG